MRNAKLRTPFDREVLENARQLAMQYRLLLDVNEQGVYLGTAMELPRVLASGATADECVGNMREALTTAVATFLEMGKAPPLPLRQNRRDEQINVRVTAEEKVRLEAAARQSGFRSVSDYIRRRGLDGAA